MSNSQIERNNLVDWFIKGIFFNKNTPSNYNDEKFSMSPTNKEDVLLAVKKAYIDMTPRTIKGLAGVHKLEDFEKEFNEILSELVDRFVDYFKSDLPQNEKEFDEWHGEICENFLQGFNKLLKDYDIEKISYGKAQKIVNMTFKYIYCFDDNIDFDYFKYCHMTLDRYTLEWFLEDVRMWLMENNCKFAKNKIPAWSNLDKGKSDKEFSYLWIQTQIRKYLNKQDKYSKIPFIAEFTIWKKYKTDKKDVPFLAHLFCYHKRNTRR